MSERWGRTRRTTATPVHVVVVVAVAAALVDFAMECCKTKGPISAT